MTFAGSWDLDSHLQVILTEHYQEKQFLEMEEETEVWREQRSDIDANCECHVGEKEFIFSVVAKRMSLVI